MSHNHIPTHNHVTSTMSHYTHSIVSEEFRNMTSHPNTSKWEVRSGQSLDTQLCELMPFVLIRIHLLTHSHTLTHPFTYTYSPIHIHLLIYTHTYSHIHTHILTDTHTLTNLHPQIHPLTHSPTHTYTITHALTPSRRRSSQVEQTGRDRSQKASPYVQTHTHSHTHTHTHRY